MAGEIQAYFIKHSRDVEYLVSETERILLENNGSRRGRFFMNVKVQDEETAAIYRKMVLESKALSLRDLPEFESCKKNYFGKSFLIRLASSSEKNKGSSKY